MTAQPASLPRTSENLGWQGWVLAPPMFVSGPTPPSLTFVDHIPLPRTFASTLRMLVVEEGRRGGGLLCLTRGTTRALAPDSNPHGEARLQPRAEWLLVTWRAGLLAASWTCLTIERLDRPRKPLYGSGGREGRFELKMVKWKESATFIGRTCPPAVWPGRHHDLGQEQRKRKGQRSEERGAMALE